VLVVVSVGVGGTTGYASGGGWLPPAPFDLQGGGGVNIAMVPAGGAIGVWGQYGEARTSTYSAADRWSPIAYLADEFFDSEDLAVDARGNALVTGVLYTGAPTVVAYQRAGGSSSWIGPIAISGTDRVLSRSSLAANARGEAVVAWSSVDADGQRVARAALRRADGTWEPPENLGYGDFGNPAASIDERGDAVVVWTRGTSNGATVYAERRAAGAAWEPAVVLSERAVAQDAGVVMNHRGEALAVWAEQDDARTITTLDSSLLLSGSADWSAPSKVPVSYVGNVAAEVGSGASFVLDDAGNATLVAKRKDGGIEALTATSDSGWGAPLLLGDVGSDDSVLIDCTEPVIAMDARGGLLVAWGGGALRAAKRPPGAPSWEKPVVVAASPSCFQLALAVSSPGDSVVIWNASTEAARALYYAILDNTPPVISEPAIPHVARAGHRVRLAVAVSDAWSSLTAPRWRFGDGTRARGTKVQHVFRRPGRYHVSATVADRAGNTASSASTIRVTKA